jgi:hypothetical protein
MRSLPRYLLSFQVSCRSIREQDLLAVLRSAPKTQREFLSTLREITPLYFGALTSDAAQLSAGEKMVFGRNIARGNGPQVLFAIGHSLSEEIARAIHSKVLASNLQLEYWFLEMTIEDILEMVEESALPTEAEAEAAPSP